MSQIVNASCALRGKSLYFTGKVNHSFQLEEKMWTYFTENLSTTDSNVNQFCCFFPVHSQAIQRLSSLYSMRMICCEPCGQPEKKKFQSQRNHLGKRHKQYKNTLWKTPSECTSTVISLPPPFPIPGFFSPPVQWSTHSSKQWLSIFMPRRQKRCSNSTHFQRVENDL